MRVCVCVCESVCVCVCARCLYIYNVMSKACDTYSVNTMIYS